MRHIGQPKQGTACASDGHGERQCSPRTAMKRSLVKTPRHGNQEVSSNWCWAKNSHLIPGPGQAPKDLMCSGLDLKSAIFPSWCASSSQGVAFAEAMGCTRLFERPSSASAFLQPFSWVAPLVSNQHCEIRLGENLARRAARKPLSQAAFRLRSHDKQIGVKPMYLCDNSFGRAESLACYAYQGRGNSVMLQTDHDFITWPKRRARTTKRLVNEQDRYLLRFHHQWQCGLHRPGCFPTVVRARTA